MPQLNMKQTLQRLAITTQFPPFTSIYRIIYAIAVRICAKCISRVGGVRSIYLRRGLAGGNPIYGLSDIDLLVMIEGDLNGKTAARVRHQYDLLRRIISMLPKPAELEIYNQEHFRLLYDSTPFYRGRFDQGRSEWKRLYGPDIFKDLPPMKNDVRQIAWQELRPAWNHLAHELLPDGATGANRFPYPIHVRRYVAYKAIAEAARSALIVRTGDTSISRDMAVIRAAKEFPEIADALYEVRGMRNNLLDTETLHTDRLLSIFLSLARKVIEATPDGESRSRRVRVLAPPSDIDGLLLSNDALSLMDKASAELEGIERAVLVPRLAFDPVATLDLDPVELAGATVDAFDLVLVGPLLPDTEALRRLNAQTEKLFPLINVFFSNGDIAVSTRPVKGWCFKHKRHAPEFFACLKSARQFRGGLEISHTIEVNRPFERENALLSRAGSLLDLFGKSEAFRLPVRSFFALFWETGRAVLLANQAQSPLVEVPATSLQIVDALARQTPNEAAVLRQIHSEYWKEARGEESEVERYMYWAGRYALLLNERLFSPGSNKERLPKKARTQLTISVTIVTRNRAPLLKRALESLVEQERAPDQVIVVDNASTDETREMVCAFAGRLKISIIPECRIGIPIARNTALMHCTGDIVALLDDDCVADRRWLAEIEKPFLRDPHIAAVGGRLTPVEGRSGLITRFYDSRMRDAAAAEALNER